MKAIRLISICVIALLLGGWIVARVLTVDIPVGSVGVRVREYGIGGKRGVEKNDFGPGWHLDLGPIHSWQFYDSTVQTLEMTRDPSFGDRMESDEVKVQSSDGYNISVDVTVKYRIKKDHAHLLYQDLGAGEKYKRFVRNESQGACMKRFGQMATEQFYDPAIRREKSQEVRTMLKENLAQKNVDVVDVLIRDVQFDKDYETKIRRKKLADQEVELNKSEAKAAETRGITQKIEAETEKLISIINQEKESDLRKMEAQTDREIATIIAKAESYATQKRADADLIDAQKEAQGKLLVKKAEAEGEKLRNEAMQGVGGNIIVALEAASNLNVSDIQVSTQQVDFLNLQEMVTRLGVPETSEE